MNPGVSFLQASATTPTCRKRARCPRSRIALVFLTIQLVQGATPMSDTPKSYAELENLPFQDASELIQAMSDPRYRSPIYPNLFRHMVERRASISVGIGTDDVHLGTREDSVYIGPSPDPAGA